MTFDIGPAEALQRFVLPALEVLCEPGEVSAITVEQGTDGEIRTSILFAGEQLRAQVWAPWFDDSVKPLASFASQLQDHIAESRYAWGTLRTYPREWD